MFSAHAPTYGEVLAARESHLAMVRELLAGVAAGDLVVPRRNPWAPEHAETTLSCLHTIFDEEWEHHRYAVRDLKVIAAGTFSG